MGDVLATSEMLSVPIKTLYDKMQRHGISSEMYKGMHTKSFLR
jgi:DNA-binding NtrC family response regulator